MNTADQNKAIVLRFNRDFIEKGDLEVFNEIISPDFINQTAPEGVPKGPEGVIYFFNYFLRPAFPGFTVEICRQVAEDNTVTTHKIFHCTHKGEFMGIPATGKDVAIEVMDIIRLENGKFIEHWNVVDWSSVLQKLAN